MKLFRKETGDARAGRRIKRRHLFEFEDQSWLPAVIRDCVTDYLRFLWGTFGFYDGAVPLLRRAARAARTRRVTDLCSGASGPWEALLPHFQQDDLRVMLTDIHPNRDAFEHARAESRGRIDYADYPVDAASVPRQLQGVRTIFSGLHHFKPDGVQAILRNAAEQRVPICVFEMTGRKVKNVVLTLLVGVLTFLVACPFIKPFRFSRLLWTYVVPVAPLVYAWDGAVSHLRTYTVDEMRSLAAGAAGDDTYVWEAGELPAKFFPVTYLVGLPKTAAQDEQQDYAA